MKLAPALTTTIAAFAALTLTACAGGDEEAGASATPSDTPTAVASPTPSESTEPTAAPSPSASPEPSETTAAAPAGDYTAPGTELATSEAIHVPLTESWYNTETEGTDSQEIAVTYTFGGIREGEAADLSDVFGDDDIAMLEDYAIFYVDYTVSLDGGALSDPAHGIADVTQLEPVDTAGYGNAGNFIFFDGGPEICAYASQTDLEDTGETAACQIVAATQGETIERLEFHGDTSAGRESDYDGNPVVWTIN